MEINLEDIMKKYKLSEEEHNNIGEEIEQIMLFNKYPVKNPTAIINIAPPASGKTGLNGYAEKQFIDNNVVIINSDELKPFHPKIDEIAKLYPEFYTKITDQESNTWTSHLFDKALKEGYNVIFEGTGRNARILETIKEKMTDYNIIVRGMAVNDLNCLLSILERYEYQLTTRGWGRLVTLEHFYETYQEMPNTIDIIEKSRLIDAVEIFKRGDIPIKPTGIYKSNEMQNRFPSAKEAILCGRKEDELEAIKNYKENFAKINRLVSSKPVSSEEQKILEKIEEVAFKMLQKNMIENGER